MVDIFDKKLLLNSTTYYTLTVVTNPSNATCTLTADGNSYSNKTLKVKKGTVVSYSIYDPTYGTKTGSVTMTANKTLTAIGTTSPIDNYYSWTQPVLTSNSGNGMSVSCGAYSGTTGHNVYTAFDSSSTTYAQFTASSFNSSNPLFITTTTAIKISSITLTFYNATYIISSGTIYGSSDGSSWTSLKSFSNNSSSCTISVNSSNVYKYHKIVSTSNNSTVVDINNVSISATYKTTSYSYDWSISVN